MTPYRLREVLNYDPHTGNFIWLITKKGAKFGHAAGSYNDAGYWMVKIDQRIYRAHRLAWLYMTGLWPKDQIDHINGIRDDNRWCNLREATRSENHQNLAISKRNTSGFIGVSWHKPTQKWVAHIKVAGRGSNLGSFTKPEDAYAVYLLAKADLHPFQPVPRSARA